MTARAGFMSDHPEMCCGGSAANLVRRNGDDAPAAKSLVIPQAGERDKIPLDSR